MKSLGKRNKIYKMQYGGNYMYMDKIEQLMDSNEFVQKYDQQYGRNAGTVWPVRS